MRSCLPRSDSRGEAAHLGCAGTPTLDVGRHPHDQRGELIGDRRSAELTLGVRPVSADEATVPAKEGLGSYAERRPALPRQEPAQRCEPGPIGRLEAGPRLLAAQDLELVAQHQDLDLLGAAATKDEHHEREQSTDDEVGERPQVGTEKIGLAHGEGAPSWKQSRTSIPWLAL